MPHFKVGQLDEYLAKRNEGSVTGKLGDFTVTNDAEMLMLDDGITKDSWMLDETAAEVLTKYLKIPAAYYKKVDPDFRATLLRYEIERHAEATTVVETLNKEVVALHAPETIMLPLGRVAEVVKKTFSDEDTVRRMLINDKRFHVDVTSTQYKVEFPGPELLTDGSEPHVLAPPQVGDITEAGIRFLSYPYRGVAPSVNVYAERLACTNGQTTDERLGKVALTGRTVDEVIQEMEQAAQLLLPQLDTYLDGIRKSREIAPPGSPQAFAAQLAREAKVKREVLDQVLDIINQLPAPVSVWDVQNAFTDVANQVERYETMARLQTLGGSLSFDTEKVLHRCGTCERLL